MPTAVPIEPDTLPWTGTRPRLRLPSQIAFSLMGNASKALTQSGYLVAMASMGSLEMAGQYAIGLAVTAPLFMFLQLGLRQLQGTDTKQDFEFADYLGLRLVSLIAGLALLLVIVASLGYPQETSLVILAVALCRAVEALADAFHGLFQRHERTDRIAWSEGVKSVTSLAAMCSVLAVVGNVLEALAAVVVVRTVLLLVQDVPWGRSFTSIRPRLVVANLAQLCRVAVPLGAVAMFVSLATNMPRYFLAEWHGEKTVGIFALMEMVLQLVLMVTISLQQATSARLSRSYFAGPRSFLRYLGYLIAGAALWGVTATAAAYWFGPIVLGWCFDGNSGSHRWTFVLLIAAAIGLNLRCILGAAMVTMRRTQLQAVLTAVSAGITFLIAWVLVPRWELMGAAWTIFLSGFVFSSFTALAVALGEKQPPVAAASVATPSHLEQAA